jgi:hypothetical protein
MVIGSLSVFILLKLLMIIVALGQIKREFVQAEISKVLIYFDVYLHVCTIINNTYLYMGPVKEIKDKLKRWCELMDVNDFGHLRYVAVVTSKQ